MICVPASPWKIALVCENTAVNHALERNAKKESDKKEGVPMGMKNK